MKFSSLGSGSKGNASLISTHSGTTRTTIMIDCGFNIGETERRLARVDLLPSDISAIVVTHEHSDHIGSVFPFARRHRIPVWMSYGTFHASRKNSDGVALHFCRDGDQIAIDDLQLTAFTVPHDAREPLQFHATDGQSKLGMLTDVGQITSYMTNALNACDALIIECNHDSRMLAESVYPWALKKRISGSLGHLSNEDASAFLAELDQSKLKKVVGAHLSMQNNTPDLVRSALCTVTNQSQTKVIIAGQEEGFEWVQIRT